MCNINTIGVDRIRSNNLPLQNNHQVHPRRVNHLMLQRNQELYHHLLLTGILFELGVLLTLLDSP